jgi:transcriptional regulator with XRE-family HTH domain
VTEPSILSGDVAIGIRLRTAREQAGISHEELAASTRISKTYLQRLEEGAFDRLPGPAYVCGFMRSYASQVGLDGDLLVQEYQRARQQPPSPQAGKRRYSLGKSSPEGRRRWAVTGILLIFVLAAAYVMDTSDDTVRSPATVPLPPKPAASPVIQERMSSTVPVQPQAPLSDLGQTPVLDQTLPADGIFLRIKAEQECWLNIDIDGEMGRQYTLRPGDVIEWKGGNRFSLDIGNAGGIQAEFNGASLGPLGKAGESVHLELTADGVR